MLSMDDSQGPSASPLSVGSHGEKLPPSTQDAERDTTTTGKADREAQGAKWNSVTPVLKVDAEGRNEELSFTDLLKQHQNRLNQDFDRFEKKLHEIEPSSEASANFDWDDLEGDYQKEIALVALKEREIMSNFDARFKVCRICGTIPCC